MTKPQGLTCNTARKAYLQVGGSEVEVSARASHFLKSAKENDLNAQDSLE